MRNIPTSVPNNPQRFAHQEEGPHQLSRKLSAMMEEMLKREMVQYPGRREWAPPVNLYESDGMFLICVDIAGMDTKLIDVQVNKHQVIISGVRSDPRPKDVPGEICVHLLEINAGAFRRIVDIPSTVDEERIQADYGSGMLWISLPKQ